MSSNSTVAQDVSFPERMPAKVIVVTGASGGHIFPALAFLETLKEKYKRIEVLLVLPQPFCKVEDILDGKSRDAQACRFDHLDCKIKYLPISTIRLSFRPKNFYAILNFFKATLEGIVTLIRFGPDIVVAFGSIICVPLVFFAWLFRIKTILHEQNVIPGRANRFLATFADKIAISFSESQNYLNASANKLVLTGNPLRTSLKEIDKREALNFFALSDSKFTILVTGGSQGSHNINLCFQQAFSNMSDKDKLQIIHLAGNKDYDLLRETYKDFKENIKLFTFFKDMHYAYSAADLVITRAGATTISEIIFFKLPAIVIPYPHAYQHQSANARILERARSAIVIEDRLLEARLLQDSIQQLLNDQKQLANMRSGYERLYRPEAAQRFVENALSLY